jgi:hypothetical protein
MTKIYKFRNRHGDYLMVNAPKAFENALVESAALDALPLEMIQYGVKLATKKGEKVDSLRWRVWEDAARFAESEVAEGRASGFWVFKEAAF